MTKKFFISFIGLISFIGPIEPKLLAADPAVAPLEKAAPTFFKAPKIQTHIFENGLKLYFLENRELPVVEMSALIGEGNIDDPAAKKGLATFMMSGLRTGGGGALSADQVDEKLEVMAAEIKADARREYSTVKLSVLAKDFNAGASLFFDLLKNPRFEPAKLELVRTRMVDAIRRRNEDPGDVASREFDEQLFGKENIWARVSTEATIGAISREDIQNFFKSHVLPNHTSLSVSGDISFEELLLTLAPLVLDWESVETPPETLPPLAKVWTPSVQFISRPVNQSSVVMGHFGDKRFNPDKYALILANYILGGSTFGSRLGNRIRTELGLAYTVYSDFGLDTDYGSFEIIAGTKTDSTVQVVQETRQILKEMATTRPITEKELQDAKDTILNQLIFQYEDPFEIVETEVRYNFYGYPPDYLTLFQKKIKEVSLDDVKQVIPRYFFPDRLKVMIVGAPTLKKELTKLGKVEELPLDND